MAGSRTKYSLESHDVSWPKRVDTPSHHRQLSWIRSDVKNNARGHSYFVSGIVSGVSSESTTKIASRLAGSLSLAFSLTL